MDHSSGAGIIARKLGCPVFIPEKSFNKKQHLFDGCIVNYVAGGSVVMINHLEIKSFSTRHDSEDCVGFIITDTISKKKIGYLTDTGSIGKLIKDSLYDCNAYMIEADYDEESLVKYADYDDLLKERISSDYGHLSNQQAMEFVNMNINLDKTDWILFGHLSEKTNSAVLLDSQIKQKFPERYWDKFFIANNALKLEIKD